MLPDADWQRHKTPLHLTVLLPTPFAQQPSPTLFAPEWRPEQYDITDADVETALDEAHGQAAGWT
jgi:hypothetical protein